MTKSPATRLAWLIGAVVQLALPPTLTVADALVERDAGRDLVGHVESHSSPTCPTPHAPDCGLCRTLSSNLALPPAAGHELRLASSALVDRREPDTELRAPALLTPRPRAPPAS